ncbi:hypothetical protein [Carboxylicivirga sp. RSCT41]|uniref:hypothetical protein n=1 Tax=Carboxylicivirga agarovorans TaxID=3417570 RepID=UPI003D3530A8
MILLRMLTLATMVMTTLACSKTTIHHAATVLSEYETIKLFSDVSDHDLKADGWEDDKKATSILGYPASLSYKATTGFINKKPGMYVYQMTLEATIDIPVELFVSYYQDKIQKEVEGGEVYPTKIGDSYYFTKGVEDIVITPLNDIEVLIVISSNKPGYIKITP